jgi:hypothetical protein
MALLSHHALGTTTAAATKALPQLPPQRTYTPPSASGGGAATQTRGCRKDVVVPVVGGKGSVAHALWERLVDIQQGRVEWEGVSHARARRPPSLILECSVLRRGGASCQGDALWPMALYSPTLPVTLFTRTA